MSLPRLALLALFCACASEPVTGRIDAAGPPFALLDYERIDGAKGPPASGSCETPCNLSFEPDSVYELELRADGYHLARFAIEYQTIWRIARLGTPPSVVVPMVKRAR